MSDGSRLARRKGRLESMIKWQLPMAIFALRITQSIGRCSRRGKLSAKSGASRGGLAKTGSCRIGRFAICCGLVTLVASAILSPGYPQTAVAAKFETHLLPSPVSDLTASSAAGMGHATATLDHYKLDLTGSFHGLAAPASDAHLFMGPGIGIPGQSVLDLTISQGASGTISGEFNLTRQQAAALRQGHMYVQINTQKSTTPYGTLWGWLLPEHEAIKQDVPEEGHWFLPQYDVPQSK